MVKARARRNVAYKPTRLWISAFIIVLLGANYSVQGVVSRLAHREAGLRDLQFRYLLKKIDAYSSGSALAGATLVLLNGYLRPPHNAKPPRDPSWSEPFPDSGGVIAKVTAGELAEKVQQQIAEVESLQMAMMFYQEFAEPAPTVITVEGSIGRVPGLIARVGQIARSIEGLPLAESLMIYQAEARHLSHLAIRSGRGMESAYIREIMRVREKRASSARWGLVVGAMAAASPFIPVILGAQRLRRRDPLLWVFVFAGCASAVNFAVVQRLNREQREFDDLRFTSGTVSVLASAGSQFVALDVAVIRGLQAAGLPRPVRDEVFKSECFAIMNHVFTVMDAVAGLARVQGILSTGFEADDAELLSRRSSQRASVLRVLRALQAFGPVTMIRDALSDENRPAAWRAGVAGGFLERTSAALHGEEHDLFAAYHPLQRSVDRDGKIASISGVGGAMLMLVASAVVFWREQRGWAPAASAR